MASEQFTITQLVRWKNPKNPLDSNRGLVDSRQATDATHPHPNLINKLLDDLKYSDIIPYTKRGYDNDKILQRLVSNVIMPNGYTFGDTLTWTLLFASHTDVIQWARNHTDKLEIIDIPDGCKINVLDRLYGLAYEDMYEYIMVSDDKVKYHF